MPTTTSKQSIPVPVAADAVDVPGDMMSLAQAIESKLVMTFSTSGDRDSKVPTPTQGMVCFVADTNSYQCYSDSAWRTFFTGAAPGSATSYGHISSYQSTQPSDARNGAVTVNRDTQQAFTKDNSGVWRPLAGAIPVANVSYRYGGAGFTTAPNAVSNFCSLTITTSVANQKLMIDALGFFSLLGVFQYLTVTGGFQDVSGLVMVTPPGGSLTELKRFTNRYMNTGGDGAATVGGPTPGQIAGNHIYTAATAGSYTFIYRLLVGTSGNGNVANIGGDMTIRPVVTTTAF